MALTSFSTVRSIPMDGSLFRNANPSPTTPASGRIGIQGCRGRTAFVWLLFILLPAFGQMCGSPPSPGTQEELPGSGENGTDSGPPGSGPNGSTSSMSDGDIAPVIAEIPQHNAHAGQNYTLQCKLLQGNGSMKMGQSRWRPFLLCFTISPNGPGIFQVRKIRIP